MTKKLPNTQIFKKKDLCGARWAIRGSIKAPADKFPTMIQ